MYSDGIGTLAGMLAEWIHPSLILRDEPMNRHTSFRTGGPADLFVMPREAEEVRAVLQVCHRENAPVLVIGNGTNLLVGDRGIRGVVVHLGNGFSEVRIRPDPCRGEPACLEAEGGALLSRVASEAQVHGLGGLAFAAGIPGSIGGAVAMNAGAYDHEMREVVLETRCTDMTGTDIFCLRGAEAHDFAYRTSVILQRSLVVLSTVLSLVPTPVEEITREILEYAKRRRRTQPLSLPSAGSVFKRPPGHYAGQLIESCGLKGCRIGGAQVSEKHAGFIVNLGGASSADIRTLIRHVQDTVAGRTGVVLEPEIRIAGEWQENGKVIAG